MMKFLNVFIITIISVLLFACGDSRGADKEEFAAAWAEEMGDDSSETGACVADAMSDALDDDAWALVMFEVRDDQEGGEAYVAENELVQEDFEEQFESALMSAMEGCTPEAG